MYNWNKRTMQVCSSRVDKETCTKRVGVMENQNCLNNLHQIVLSLRPWSFSASFTAVGLGVSVSFTEHNIFCILVFFMTIVCIVSVHGAGNLINTYYDYQNHVDSDLSDDQTLVKKNITPEEVYILALSCYMCGFISFAGLAYFSLANLASTSVMFLTGVLGSFMYTGGLGLKYHALGDVVVVMAFGFISTEFAFIVQTGFFSWQPLFYALPVMSLTEAILHGNNTRDSAEDTKAGIVTIASLLGRTYSGFLFTMLILLPYFFIWILTVWRSILFILPFFTLHSAVALEKTFRADHLKNIPQKTAQLNLCFSALYMLSILLH